MSLGAGALKAGGAGQQFWHREGGIHRNPASGHHPGTVTLIQSVEYLPTSSTYPWEGGVSLLVHRNIFSDEYYIHYVPRYFPWTSTMVNRVFLKLNTTSHFKPMRMGQNLEDNEL